MEKNKLRNNATKRERKCIIAFNAEGKNKTESIYLDNYKSRNVILKNPSGNSTDPRNMFLELKKYCAEQDIRKEYGDRLYLFIDSDLNEDKMKVINTMKKDCDKFGVEIILSVPIFEVWFLNHFRYSAKEFKSGEDVIKELNKFIDGYKKGNNYYNILSNRTECAVERSIKLEKHHKDLDNDLLSNKCNPYTGMYKVISGINDLKDKNERNK